VNKIKLWDWAAVKFRSSKIFNADRPNPMDLNELLNDIGRLSLELALLEQKPDRSFTDNERIGELKRNINELANRDTGQRYFQALYLTGAVAP
jgi:hypothetical protein